VAAAVRGLVKRYKDGTEATRGISLEVRRGEVVAILGPNGAGKTTFLRQLTTELAPTSGGVSIFGIDAVREPERARRMMGITPQEAGLFESLRVRDHLELFARLKGIRARDAGSASREVMQQLGLSADAERRVQTLSGGQRRRILIGLALLGGPPLLILDEPTTGLDPVSRRTVWRVLRGVVRSGATVILSTHYLEEAEQLSDRIGIINHGAMMAFGTLSELTAALRRSYRLTYHDPEDPSGVMRIQHHASFADLQADIRRQALSEYSIARVSLEDVYLELAGECFPDDDATEVAQ
jgi:ABC-2 type transport system ATP-binding protein